MKTTFQKQNSNLMNVFKNAIVLLIIILSFNQNSFSDNTPRYEDCESLYSLSQMNCNNWETIKEVIELYPGCFVEVDYLLKRCTLANATEHLKMELIGFRVINYPGCTALTSNLYLPNGNLNEAYARMYLQQIYVAVSDKWMKEKINQLNLSTNPMWYCNSGFQPFHNVMFFEAKEGTCMALCRTTQVVQYTAPPFGLVGPGIGTYTTEYISNVKCTNSCCHTIISYCYDRHQNSWVRTTMRDSYGASLQCPNPPIAIEPCYTPPIFVGEGNVVISSSTTELFPCVQTCDQISSPEYLNW